VSVEAPELVDSPHNITLCVGEHVQLDIAVWRPWGCTYNIIYNYKVASVRQPRDLLEWNNLYLQ